MRESASSPEGLKGREAGDLIARIRSSSSARRIQGHAGNLCGTYPSRKMGVTIQFESHTVELRAIYQMEDDPEVLEYYDQPPSLKLSYPTHSGRKITRFHTPDFFSAARHRPVSASQCHRMDASSLECPFI